MTCRSFKVYNENATGGAFLGYLVLDLYQRDGKTLGGKVSRFSTASHLSSSSHNHYSCTISNIGKKFYNPKIPEPRPAFPALAIQTSLPRATQTKVTLLNQAQIRLFVHELGHAIHELSRGSAAAVPRDFIEVPSMMLEMWTYLSTFLQRISYHYAYLQPEIMATWQAGNPGESRPPKHIPLDMFKYLPQLRILRYSETHGMIGRAVYDILIHAASVEQLLDMDLADE
jgi:metallopeptidase MepB